MPANWSLVFEFILLTVVVLMIRRFFVANRKALTEMPVVSQASNSTSVIQNDSDDIIAVRKISPKCRVKSSAQQEQPDSASPIYSEEKKAHDASSVIEPLLPNDIVMFLLQAKEKRVFSGYELLQTLLSADLRFGDGHLFHRHQNSNGTGPVLCSVAAATSTGKFELSNMGSFSTKGLCLFMRISGNMSVDKERFNILVKTAKQLSLDLQGVLLDENKTLLTEAEICRYAKRIGIANDLSSFETVSE